MLNQNKTGFFICFVVSFALHFFVFSAVFYKKQNEQLFLQIPFEVSFYSPSQDFADKNNVQPVLPENKIEKKPEPEKKTVKKEVKKKDVVVNSKKEEKQKELPVKEEETTSKEQTEEESNEQSSEENNEQTSSQNASGFMPGKGIMLENTDFKYSYYTTAIVKKISRYWQWANSYSSYRAVVYFRIERDGFVRTAEIKESSGNEGFDENALRAVRLASPFAPLPDGYSQNYLGVYFEFKIK